MDVSINQNTQQEKVEGTKKSRRLFNFKSLRTKILFGFGLVILLVAGLVTITSLSSNTINQESKLMKDHQIPLMIADERVGFSIARRSTNVRAYLMTGEPRYRTMFEESSEAVIPYLETLGRLSESETIDNVIAAHEEWTQGMLTDVFDVYESGNEALALENMSDLAPTTTMMLDELSAAAREREVLINEAQQDIIETGTASLITNIILAVVILIVSITIAVFTARSIANPIKKVMERMHQIQEGNLKNQHLEVTTQDETGKLSSAANAMQERLKELVSSISEVSYLLTYNSKELSETSSEVMAGTDQVAMTMQELSEGSETQANSASKLASIMDIFSNKVSDTNKSGQYITKLSNKVLEETTSGKALMESSEEQMQKINDIVKQSVERVDDLDTQTQEISKLVEIIQNIANQTNLLALNAAIEAARAGDHGKGFAVVADEVRKLAEQVDVSVSEITGFVESIQVESRNVSDSLQEGYTEVKTGTSKIKATGDTFNQITRSLNDVDKQIRAINSNLTDLKDSTEEMNVSIEEVASVSEESAAGVEETSAATQQINSSMEEMAGDGGKISQLVELAQNMDNLLKGFKI
ncbi:methyl-accepting chemotaxis protein [Marinilactibacillus piezotolerans]|uniref:methyl-accepting chemotaxis protein n=1 Tax=Marinilactibacillus piezotolerans TaxID=258723 RepID=UPI0009B1A776|nr:methyl-accepting chemotaxis protein [Marinilactibacillus piezotolerans]